MDVAAAGGWKGESACFANARLSPVSASRPHPFWLPVVLLGSLASPRRHSSWRSSESQLQERDRRRGQGDRRGRSRPVPPPTPWAGASRVGWSATSGATSGAASSRMGSRGCAARTAGMTGFCSGSSLNAHFHYHVVVPAPVPKLWWPDADTRLPHRSARRPLHPPARRPAPRPTSRGTGTRASPRRIPPRSVPGLRPHRPRAGARTTLRAGPRLRPVKILKKNGSPSPHFWSDKDEDARKTVYKRTQNGIWRMRGVYCDAEAKRVRKD